MKGVYFINPNLWNSLDRIPLGYFAQCLSAQLILICVIQVRQFYAWDLNPSKSFLSEATLTAQSASYNSANFDPTNIDAYLKKIIDILNTFNKVTVPRQERVLCFWKRPLLKKTKALWEIVILENCIPPDTHFQ